MTKRLHRGLHVDYRRTASSACRQSTELISEDATIQPWHWSAAS